MFATQGAAIEISDNVVPLSSRERKAQIRAARSAGLVRRGKPSRRTLDLLLKELSTEKIMIELPGPWIPEVRKCDVEALGPDVNLANVAPEDLLDLETTRVGLGVAGPPKSLLG